MLYTDGVTEARARGSLFGEERLRALVAEGAARRRRSGERDRARRARLLARARGRHGDPDPAAAREPRIGLARSSSARARLARARHEPAGRAALGLRQVRIVDRAAVERHRAARVEAAAASGSPSRPAARPAAAPARRVRGSMRGATASRAFVYGCCGSPSTCSVVPISTMRPRYMTATRSHIDQASPTSCVIRSSDSCRETRRSASRRSTCVRTETSSAETGSSQTSASGSSASAAAITTRWRWPPESSCG